MAGRRLAPGAPLAPALGKRDRVEVAGDQKRPLKHEHSAHEDLAPYLAVIGKLAAGCLGPPPEGVHRDGAAKPLAGGVAADHDRLSSSCARRESMFGGAAGAGKSEVLLAAVLHVR